MLGNLQVGDMMAFITYTMQIVMSFLMITMVSVMLPALQVSAADRIEEIFADGQQHLWMQAETAGRFV